MTLSKSYPIRIRRHSETDSADRGSVLLCAPSSRRTGGVRVSRPRGPRCRPRASCCENAVAAGPRQGRWRGGKGTPTSGRHARERETCADDVGPCQRECRTTFSCRRGERADPIMGVSPRGGRHRCAERSERRVPRSRPDDAERPGPGREANHPRTRGPSLPPACGGLCRPEVGVPLPTAPSRWLTSPRVCILTATGRRSPVPARRHAWGGP